MGNLVRQARRRILGNQLFTQGANAGTAALVAFILLLLFGTQVLSWQVALLIPLAAAAFGLYRVQRQMPSRYAVAQLIDHRLGLADNLSTALFFSEVEPSATVAPEIRAGSVRAGRPPRAIGGRPARRALHHAALGLCNGQPDAGGGQPVCAALRPFAGGWTSSSRWPTSCPNRSPAASPHSQAKNARRNSKQTPETPDDGSTAANPDQQNPGQEPDQEIQAPGESQTESIAKMDAKSMPTQKPGEQGDNEMASDDADSQGEGAASQNSEEGQDGQQGDSKGGQSDKQNGDKQDAKNASESSSLMSKMKDAFQNLLSKAKPPAEPARLAATGSRTRNPRKARSAAGLEAERQRRPTAEGGQQGDAQEGEDGQEAKNSENAQQGKGQGKSDSQQSSKQPGSGIGSQDGDKGIRNAEQLAAMGKISEIRRQARRHNQRRGHGGSADHQSATAHAVCAEGRGAYAGRRARSAATKFRWRCSLTCSNTSSRCANRRLRRRRSSRLVNAKQ